MENALVFNKSKDITMIYDVYTVMVEQMSQSTNSNFSKVNKMHHNKHILSFQTIFIELISLNLHRLIFTKLSQKRFTLESFCVERYFFFL